MSNVSTPRSQYDTYAFLPSALARALWANVAPKSPWPQNGPREKPFIPAPQLAVMTGRLGLVTSTIMKSPWPAGSNHSLNGWARSA